MITDDYSMMEAVKSEDYVDIDNIYALVPIEVRLHMQRVNNGCKILSKLLYRHIKENGQEADEELKCILDNLDSVFKYHDVGYGFLPTKTICMSEDGNDIFDMRKFYKLEFSKDGIISSHTELGTEAFDMPLFRYVKEDADRISKEVSGFHHEKWDGTGYPEGLKGEQIPLAARICAVMDMYDMFTEYLPSTAELKNSDVLEALDRVSGEYLQPGLVEIVKENADIFYMSDVEAGNIKMF